ncbi:hypothetical protein A2U01_0067739, partial [Trifolium medium]|nr:hypothetical protein [Trifolium medium]
MKKKSKTKTTKKKGSFASSASDSV